MELTGYVDSLQRQLAVAAEAGGDQARELAERLAAPLDAAARLVLLEALAAAAGEITAELAPASVDLRLRGRDPEFVVTQLTPRDTTGGAHSSDANAVRSIDEQHLVADAEPPPIADGAFDPASAATTRTTLRLPDELKARAEAAAAREGVSVNTWLVRAVAAALEPAAAKPKRPARPGRGERVTGWAH